MNFCKCGCGTEIRDTWAIGHNRKSVAPWNKGKKGSQVSWNKGNIGFNKGHIGYNKDKPWTDEQKEKLKGRVPWNKGKKGLQVAWNKGLEGYQAGEKHYNWQGGKSFEPYGIEFTKSLKEQIRERDKHTCQECSYTEKYLGYKLPVHHIDFNKKNNIPENLISLCRSCHSKTEYDRDKWIDYYRNKVQ